MASQAVTHEGDVAAAKHLQTIGDRGGDLRGAAAKVRTVVRRAQTERFDSSGFGKWPKLAKSTVASKARAHRDPRPLRSTGALFRALTAARAKGQIDDRKRDTLAFGTNLPYAHFHEEGKGVPQRELEEFPHALDKAIGDAMDEYITEGR